MKALFPCQMVIALHLFITLYVSFIPNGMNENGILYVYMCAGCFIFFI